MKIHKSDPADIRRRLEGNAPINSWQDIMETVAYRASVREGIFNERVSFGAMQEQALNDGGSWDSN